MFGVALILILALQPQGAPTARQKGDVEVKVGPGRAYIGVGSSKTPEPTGVSLPTLRVESIVALKDACR